MCCFARTRLRLTISMSICIECVLNSMKLTHEKSDSTLTWAVIGEGACDSDASERESDDVI